MDGAPVLDNEKKQRAKRNENMGEFGNGKG